MAGDKSHSVLRPSGTIIITPESGGEIHIDTQQCCHCGAAFAMVKGSGRTRGWCQKCGDITCGAEACDRCVPLEKQLERMEKGLPPLPD